MHRSTDHHPHGKDVCATACQQGQPLVLKGVRILELIHEDVPETALIMRADRLISLQELIGSEQQFGKIHNALALALRLIKAVDLNHPATKIVERLDVIGPQALFLGAIDKTLHVARRIFLIVDASCLEHTLDGSKLVRSIQDLKCLWQARITMMGTQHPIAQAMEGANPHAARINRQNGSYP